MQNLLGNSNLITNSGELKVSELSSAKIIGFYFTAHWCPPCRTFTPKLISLYKSSNTGSKVFEIVFISFDRDSETMNNYLEEMPWAAVPYSDKSLRENLGNIFSVSGIPALMIFRPDGSIVSSDGRSDVYSKNQSVVDFWIKKAENPNSEDGKEDEENKVSPDIEVEESTISRDPLEGLVCDKNHYLIWHGDVGKYYNEVSNSPKIFCDYCKATMKRSSWHCRECRFDLCKDCRDWVVESKKLNNSYLKCWNSHFLLMSTRLKEYYMKKFGAEKYTCRSCNTVQSGTNLHCRRCYFDICENCQRYIETYAPVAQIANCTNGHSLAWVPELSKNYQKKYGAPRYSCNICTRVYNGSGSFNCFPCTYDICTLCIEPIIQSLG